jgi:rsbT antagonist protein RsbS
MNNRSSISGMYAVNNCLIVPIRDNIDDDELKNIGKLILHHLKEFDSRGVLIDVSSVSIMGSYGFTLLKNIARAITMMGADAVFVGFQPGVASSLVDIDMDLNGIITSVNTEDAFKILEPKIIDKGQEDIETDEDQRSETDSDGQIKAMEDE